MSEILRQDVDVRHKWALEDIFKNDELFDKELKEAEEVTKKLVSFKGKLKNKKSLLEFFKSIDRAMHLLYRVYMYSNMRLHEDASNAKYQELSMRTNSLMSIYEEMTSFVSPELAALDEKILEGFLKDKDFSPYDMMLKDAKRNKKHTLSDSEEALLSSVSSFSNGFQDAFEMLNNLEIDFGETTWIDGTKKKLTHGSYAYLLSNCKDREIRKEAREKYMAAYKKVLNTISTMYAGNVKKNWFLAKARNHATCLDSALNDSNVPKAVYDNLIESVDENVSLMHRFLHLRKKVMGLSKMFAYDTIVPMFEGVELKMPFDEAYELVAKSLEVMGKEYVDLIKKAKEDRWIDIYENKGKRSGAYQWGPYGTHPYVLLNYKETTRDIFTITHEMGHAMHSYYSKKTQPISKGFYKIFVAEVASTVNEVILIRHLLKTTNNEALKKYLLSYFIGMFKNTCFTQTMFASFEKEAHALAEKNEPLSEKALSGIYEKLSKKYDGDAIEDDEFTSLGWARIPHFYSAFYVYQYATGILSAVLIADNILKQDEEMKNGKRKTNDALTMYEKFLKTGGSDYPVDLLKQAGVDLTKKESFDSAFKVLKGAMEELEKLC
ncbi:MAG: oligoendopeptidase F [Firmicutes bacterium]|nr:oligoendopeptidase F [Bacillota bacterium]